jgi:peptide/nickel transport system substrate-binding protein
MSLRKKGPKIMGDFEFSDLKLHQQQEIVNAVRKGATRRDIMTWMMAAGATATTGGAIFGSASQVLASTPKRGGRLVCAGDQHGPADTLDPILCTASVDYWRGRMFYGNLVRLKADLSWEPELAEEVLVNSDATKWTFKLRKGVEFHNGKTMNADDVVYTLSRHMGEDTKSIGKSQFDMVTSVKKVNEFEVECNLETPNADLVNSLGTFHFRVIQDGVEDFSTAIGTGPYRCKEFKPGVRTVGTPFENCWHGPGYLDEMEHFGIGDPVARLNAFMAGDVDMMVNLPGKAVKEVEAAAGKEVWSVESGRYTSIVCHQGVSPSNNRDLIRAMQMCMDRTRVVKGELKGLGSVGNDQPINKAYFDYSPDIPQRELDLDKAKFHFEKSGVGSTTIPIIAAEVSQAATFQCLALQREAKKIGMNWECDDIHLSRCHMHTSRRKPNIISQPQFQI